MTKEELVEKLKPLKTEWIDCDKHGFSRTLKINSDYFNYIIIWYINQCTLITNDGVEIWFDDLVIKDSYPSSTAKSWIYLFYGGNDIGVHIPVIKY